VRRGVDRRPRLRDHRLALQPERERRRGEPERRLGDRDPARTHRGGAALAPLADGAAGAVGVAFAALGAADEAVAAHHGSLRADTPCTGRARIAAGETWLAALLAGILGAVATVRQLQLVGTDV